MKRFESTLIIDDDKTSQFVCEKIIRFLNLTDKLTIFEKAEEALQFLGKLDVGIRQELPYLILLDLDMPVMDGFDFIKLFNKLKIAKSKIFIVVLATTSPYSKNIQSIKKLGIKYYITKPLTIGKMKELCDHILIEDSQNFVFFG